MIENTSIKLRKKEEKCMCLVDMLAMNEQYSICRKNVGMDSYYVTHKKVTSKGQDNIKLSLE
jgi:hypothetical protein